MSVFGVPEAEEEIYRHFLRNPGTRSDDLRPLVHSRPGEARARIARLQELGLLHAEDAERRIFPVDPEPALTRLVDVRLAALHRELRRVTRSRHVIDGLRAEQGGAGSGAGAAAPRPSGIERRVLVSMCTVGKDEAGARGTGGVGADLPAACRRSDPDARRGQPGPGRVTGPRTRLDLRPVQGSERGRIREGRGRDGERGRSRDP
ncbi:hypothetical protein GA0115253_100932 [Streptomyces sp. Termitarium-T10T-6]|nr:hypothetical protein GA0115253_100932 [Streptomyces sp. Termitarium-T10T-6]